jgi:hypothetical protein
VSGEPRDPDQIRDEVEETRRQVGDTVAALAEKADVKAQARGKVEDAHARLLLKRDELRARVGRGEGAPGPAGRAASAAAATARERPVPLAIIGATIAGFVLGRVWRRR